MACARAGRLLAVSRAPALNVAELRERARRRLPKGIFEFVARGTEDDLAVRNLRRAFELVSLRPRVLVDVSARSQETEIFGKRSSMPLAVSPTGAAGLIWYEGEIELARAAAKAGIPFTLSTASITSMEKVAEQAGGRLWFQLYMWPDQRMSLELIQRVAAAGYEALIVTVDTPVTPNREYNRRNGFQLPFRFNRRNLADILCHPRWALGVMGRYLLASGMPQFENFPEELRRSLLAAPSPSRGLPKTDALTWEDFRRLRELWKGPLLIKGILRPDDAETAARCGADGLVVSNHGGRNLDASVAPLQALPEIVAAVGSRLTVALDGGITRGSDVVKALALGAKLVFAGRAPLWGVASDGEAGATDALRLLREETDRVMGYSGCRGLEDIGPDLVRLERGFLPEGRWRPAAAERGDGVATLGAAVAAGPLP